jgi:hypothetical protein
MKRLLLVAVLVGCALLVWSRPAAAQCNSAPPVRSPGDVGAYQRWCEACGGTFRYSGSMSSLRCDPGPNWGRRTDTASTGALNSTIYQASYQLGYALGRWLFGSSSNPQQELQKRLMMEELRRRQEAADRQLREDRARFLANVYNRLAGILKLTGGPALHLKEIGMGAPPLALKLGDTAGAPGSSDSTSSARDGKSGLQPKFGEPETAAPHVPVFDPEKMTPQTLADAAELVGKLPPEELQRVLAQAEHDAASGELPPAIVALEQQADASRAAADTTDADAASARARAGFDQPPEPGPVQVGADTTPALLREPGTAIDREDLPPPAAPPPPPGTSGPPSREDTVDVLKMLFPAPESKWPGAADPNAPLNNPLREEQSLRAELKWWDDWAVLRAKRPPDEAGDPLSVSLDRMIDRSAVEDYAPDLLNRFDNEPGFGYELSIRLRAAEDKVRLPYYQAQAEVHKAAVLALQAEMEKLAEAGTIERLAPLFDQFRRHPEREAIVRAVRARIAAEERAALEKAASDFAPIIDKEYHAVFRAIRGGKSQ